MKSDLPDPFKLKETAQLVESAKSAQAEADTAEQEAEKKRFTANHKTAAADAAWRMTKSDIVASVSDVSDTNGVGTATVPQPSPNKEKQGMSTGAVLGIVALVLAILALVAAFVLALNKPSAGEVSAASNVANTALSTAHSAKVDAAKADAKADSAQKAADRAQTTADAAAVKAQDASALAGKCGTSCCTQCCQSCAPKASVAQKHKPAKPAVKPAPKKPAVKQDRACNGSCVETPVAKKEREEAHPSGQCGIAALGPDGKTIVAKLTVRELKGKISITKVPDFMTDADMKAYLARTGQGLSPHHSPWAATGSCDADQAVVEKNWDVIVRQFDLPNNCKPVVLGRAS